MIFCMLSSFFCFTLLSMSLDFSSSRNLLISWKRTALSYMSWSLCFSRALLSCCISKISLSFAPVWSFCLPASKSYCSSILLRFFNSSYASLFILVLSQSMYLKSSIYF
jgi:hypothetical protein